MRVLAPYGNTNLSSWLIALVILGLVTGIPYLAYLFLRSRDIELAGLTGGLFSVVLIVLIIAGGGLAMMILSPITQALSDKGRRALEFSEARVIDVHNEISVDLTEAHLASLSGSQRIARVELFGPQKGHRIPITIRGVSRQELLDRFDAPHFVVPLTRVVEDITRLDAPLREERAAIADPGGREAILQDGFTLDASKADHAEIFEAIIDALYANRHRNVAFAVHSQFPWRATSEPDTEYARRLDLDDPADAAIAERVEQDAYVHVAPWAHVSADYVLFHQIEAGDIALDIATLGRRDFDAFGAHYLMPLGHIESHHAETTSVGTSEDNLTMDESVFELRGTNRRGELIRLHIPRTLPSSGPLDDDTRGRLERETLHRFVNKVAARAHR